MMMLETTEGIIQLCMLVAAEVIVLILLGVAAHFLIRLLVSRVKSLSSSEVITKRCEAIQRSSRLLFTIVTMLFIAGVTCYNSWLVYENKNAVEVTYDLIRYVPSAAWTEIGLGLLYILVAIIAARILNAMVCKYVNITFSMSMLDFDVYLFFIF